MEDERDGVAMEIASSTTTPTRRASSASPTTSNTVDGGTHLTGFRQALTRTINYAGQQMGLFKDVKETSTGDDVAKALSRSYSVKLSSHNSKGQTKGKLNSDIAGTVQAFVNEKLGAFFDRTQQ